MVHPRKYSAISELSLSVCLSVCLSLSLTIYIWSEIFGSPIGKKVKSNMADMEALSYVGFNPPAQGGKRKPRREIETDVS